MSSYDCLDLCRLCLVKDRVSVPIFEGEGDVRQIFLKITACLPVKVAREDKLPKKICDDCVYKVELLYEFWNTTANAEKQLLQWLGDVGMEDKRGYVSSVMNSELMKQETVENRLDGTVMQTEEHQNNMGINMMDQMGLTMPIIMSTDQQQMTSVSMASSGNNIQAVPGTSTQSSQRGRKSGNNDDDDEEESEEEDNTDDECDNEEGLSVKEESTVSNTTGRSHEPAFVNVSIPCDEAGPSGLQQQQKISDLPEMVMTQTADGDPKSGLPRRATKYQRKKQKISHQCPNCDAIFSHVMKLVEHMKNLHNISHAFNCDECGKKFRSPMNIKRHKLIHTGNKRFSCDLCNFKSFQKSNLDAHKKRHRRDFAFKCKICDKGFISKAESLAHEDIHRNLRAHKCEICSKSYNYRRNLNEHMRQEHRQVNQETNVEVKPKECDICLDTFPNAKSLKKHKKVVHGKGQVLCDVCGLKLASKNSLESHERIHTGVKLFQCDVCVKSFTKKSGLIVHRRIHTGEKPYSCQQCGKEFTQRSSLVVHLRYHNNERPYSCDDCHKSFVTGTLLRKHQAKVHENID